MTKPSMSQYLTPEDFQKDLEIYLSNQDIEPKDILEEFDEDFKGVHYEDLPNYGLEMDPEDWNDDYKP